MPTFTIPYQQTGYFSALLCDYLSQKETVSSFYGHFPTSTNFALQIKEKQASFSQTSRQVLVQQLQAQYKEVATSPATQQNIQSLTDTRTFTITTGHQLNLFTGPLYFLYKIISVINLSERLKKEHPSYNFVPVYWMATEDHDFDEINYFNFDGKKIVWDREARGAVGELSTQGLQTVLAQLKQELGQSIHAKVLLSLFEEGYVKQHNLAVATRYIANELFKEYGLVIVDGNDTALKKQFAPFAEMEITQQLSHTTITKTTKQLTVLGYPEQVHPREINLFYLKENLRERIIEKEGIFYVNETSLQFTKEEILQEILEHPERFSPNALLRPLYQEVILPNLCYTGGGGELAYWFQLKDYFKTVEVPFPILLLRNSALLMTDKQVEKLKKLDASVEDLFLKQNQLIEKVTRKVSDIEIDFTAQKDHLKTQFETLYSLAKQTDASFIGAVAAQEKKQTNGLAHLEKRLLKAQKKKEADHINRVVALQDDLFPKQSLQERNTNFTSFYLEYGSALIPQLKEALDPLAHQFTILTMK